MGLVGSVPWTEIASGGCGEVLDAGVVSMLSRRSSGGKILLLDAEIETGSGRTVEGCQCTDSRFERQMRVYDLGRGTGRARVSVIYHTCNPIYSVQQHRVEHLRETGTQYIK